MKKYTVVSVVLIWVLFSCTQQSDKIHLLNTRIDSLESKLAQSYTPGIGEFMGSIQTHHSKLWFAGQNQNWKLADFEVHEMMEALENIQKYKSDRKEVVVHLWCWQYDFWSISLKRATRFLFL